jgi:hypothetical protein
MTAKQLAELAVKQKPHIAYAYNKGGNAVAAWQGGRWVMVAGFTIDKRWVSFPGELLINGEPMHKQSDWIGI